MSPHRRLVGVSAAFALVLVSSAAGKPSKPVSTWSEEEIIGLASDKGKWLVGGLIDCQGACGGDTGVQCCGRRA